MDTGIRIPKPINFNPLKHHQIEIVHFLDEASKSDLLPLSDSISHNNVDIYAGKLSSDKICRSIISIARRNGFFLREDFEDWLRFSRGHRYLCIEDKSIWIIRRGDDDERYMHIHPAKSGPYSIRFKGATLKTVYQLKNKYPAISGPPSLNMVNLARIEIGLSPVKRLMAGKGMLKCWNSFFPG